MKLTNLIERRSWGYVHQYGEREPSQSSGLTEKLDNQTRIIAPARRIWGFNERYSPYNDHLPIESSAPDFKYAETCTHLALQLDAHLFDALGRLIQLNLEPFS